MGDELLTVREAVERLDVPQVKDRPRWLRGHLRDAETRTGRVLLVRVGDGCRRPTYRVDMEAVRLTCPELISTTDALARALRGCAVTGREELASMREYLDETNEKIAALATAMQRLEMRLRGRGPVGR